MSTELTFTHETYAFGEERPPQHLWLLRGPEGVVQFKAGRHRREPGACDTCRDFRDIGHFDNAGNCWQAWDLGYHSPTPRHEGQAPIETGEDVCEVLQMEADCYYDGTALGASDLLNHYLAADCDETVIREAMAERYRLWLVDDDGEVFASPASAFFEAIRRAQA